MQQLDQPGAISLCKLMRSRIHIYTERHLTDANLAVGQIAIRLNCSKR